MSAKRNRMWSWIILTGTAVMACTAAQAGTIQLQAYTGAIGGSNECPGGGPPAAASFFSTSPTFGLGAGGNGISDCGLTGSVSNVVNVGTTPANSQTNLNNAGYLNAGSGTYSAAASANANFGLLTVSADGLLTGTEPGNGYSESIAFAIAYDTINIPVGTAFMEFQFTINGGLNQSANDIATGIIEAQVQVGSVSQRAFYGLISEGSSGVLGPLGGSVPGCVTGTGSFQCTNGVFSTTMLPVSPGMGVDFDLGLMVSTDLLNGPSSVDPSPGMSLTGIGLFDANGNPITNFSLTSGSGAVYGANGLVTEPTSAAPEPASLWLLASGILLIAVARIRRRFSSERMSPLE